MRCRTRFAFSLVELLVVVGVIAIVVAMLLPLLIGAGEQARRVACQSNVRQIVQAMHLYAQTNGERMPSTALFSATPREHDWIHWQRSYRQLGNSAIARYLGRNVNPWLFRCPSDPSAGQPLPASSAPRAYDYSYTMNMNLGFCGTRRPPKLSQVRRPSDVILIVEQEDTGIDDGTWMNGPLDTDFVSTVHDRSARPSKQLATRGQMVNPNARAVVGFLDGSVGYIPKREAHSARHTQPALASAR